VSPPPAKQSIDNPAPRSVREAGSLPYPDRPIGTVNEQMPFDHIVVVMMENHSFDNLLGALSRTRSDVDGLSFDSVGGATNSNPGSGSTPPEVMAFPLNTTAQGPDVSQSWKDTHEQIDGGAMDGFVRSMGSNQPMGYYPAEVLPFAYSLASTFTLANRWFCSVPGPTYPEPSLPTRRNRLWLHSHELRHATRASTAKRHDLRHAFQVRHHMV
jgi:phospholipase C